MSMFQLSVGPVQYYWSRDTLTAFYAEVARTTFDRLSSGAGDPRTVIEALARPEPPDLVEVIEEIPAPPPERRSRAETLALHQRILDRLGPVPVPEDQVIRDLGGAVGQIAPALTDLELEGRLERRPGGLLSRTG